jgi:phage gp36-like protein
MDYITNNDIEERLGTTVLVQLTDDEGTGAADADKIDEARIGAQGLADSYLARRYAVPVDATGDAELAGLLRSITLDLGDSGCMPAVRRCPPTC